MRTLFLKVCIFIFILGSLQTASFAEAKEQSAITLTLEEVLHLSLRANPEIKRIDADLAEKLAKATEVQLLSNPEVQAQYLPKEELGSQGNSHEYEIQAGQPLRLSHFGMRQTYAVALKQTANIEKQADLIKILNDTTLLYYRLWMLQKREQIFADSEKQAYEVTQRIAQALEKKETPLTEGNLLKAEAIRFGAELKATQAERMEVQAELLRSIGWPWKEVKLAPPVLRPIPADLFKLQSFAQGRSNLRNLILAKQRAANRRYDVARMDMFPELTPQFLYSRSIDGSEEKFGGGIAFRVPLWDWNQAEIERAKAQKKFADAEVDAFDRLTFDRIIEIRMKRAIALQQRADTYWKDVLPAYQKSYELSRHMFEQGQASMLQLWQVQQKVGEINEMALKDTVDALAARTLLEQVLGGNLEEIP